MSAGHGHSGDLDTAPLSTAALNRVLADPAVSSRLATYHDINRDYDLPYLAGYSKDGKTIYIDRHLPSELSYELDGQRKVFDPTNFVCLHEIMEKACIDGLGWHYYHAHAAANGYERRGVLTSGMMWGPYNKALEPCIKTNEHEKLKSMPPDLDLTPYLARPVDQRLIAHIEKAMGGNYTNKKNKNEVAYSGGHPTSHCGPTTKWPRGSCSHFVGPSSCELVRGYIDPKYWCELWEDH